MLICKKICLKLKIIYSYVIYQKPDGLPEQSIKAVWVSFDSIVKTLEEMSTAQYFDKNTRSQALGIAKKILTFDFVVSLYFMKNVMY